MNHDVPLVPAPWNLTGRGYIILYRFTEEEVRRDPFLLDQFRENYAGGFGAVMAVDYRSSDVGPYTELLFTPGRFRYGDKKFHTISRIYVSTRESVINGRINWAIPKERADFTFERYEDGTERVRVEDGGRLAFEARFRPRGFPFPVHTAALPFPLVQIAGHEALFTRFSGRGLGRLARVSEIWVDATLFPAAAEKAPLAVIAVEPFRITFPIARRERIA